jgi:hypothetical protein
VPVSGRDTAAGRLIGTDELGRLLVAAAVREALVRETPPAPARLAEDAGLVDDGLLDNGLLDPAGPADKTFGPDDPAVHPASSAATATRPMCRRIAAKTARPAS